MEQGRRSGPSATLDIVQLNQKYRYMSVQYDGFAVQTPNAPPDVFVDDNTGDGQFPPTLPTTVILDSGAPYTTMPSEHLGWLSDRNWG
jgi:hypothetical protein